MKELRVCMESALPDKEVKKAWFTLPIDEEDVFEKLGVDVDNDEYRIIETDVPFKTDIKENTSIWRLNDLFYTFLTLPHFMQLDCELLLERLPSLDFMDLEKFAGYLEENGRFLKTEHGIYQLP